MKRCKQRGFSLVELIVVVAIILVLGAISAPTLFRAIRAYRAESNMRRVAGMLRQARAEAARRNTRVQILYLPPAGGRGALFGLNFPDANGNFNTTFDPGNPGEPSFELPAFYLAINCTNPCGPINLLPDPDYNPVFYHSRITFSPRGTVVQQNPVTLTWQTSNNISVFYLFEQRQTVGAAFWTEFNHYFPIAVTPAGHVRPFTLQGGVWVPK